jgi:hypothetical protein
MTTDDFKRQDDLIERLITAEADEALEKFRSGDFAEKVRTRIESVELPPKKRFAPLSGRFWPTWAAIAGGIVIAAAVLFWSKATGPGPDMAAVIESFIRLEPAVRAVESPAPSPPAIVSALLAGRQSAIPPKRTAPDANAPVRVGRPAPLGLEEMYKILFVDKSIERVLALMSS